MSGRASHLARRYAGKGESRSGAVHANEELALGLVISTHGRHCLVEAEGGRRLICHPRGKKSEVVVGDRVRWQPTPGSGDEGVIEAVEPRRNLMWRQDEWRSKSFAANLDLLLMWVAVEPVFSEAQLARALIAAHAAGIEAAVVLNKIDLPAADTARARLAPYRAMGYEVIECSLKHRREEALGLIRRRLDHRATLVLGPSGAGKSTLINACVPQAQAEVGEISQALNSGRHTTTATRWYWLDDGQSPDSALIDSPGFQEFGLHHVAATDLASHMPDLSPYLGQCRFHNCTHRQEPGCAVLAAAGAGNISPTRLSLYQDFFEELSRTRW
ncbi:MAG: ribosome small subunit-dependent GTPase A [Aquabacterium sp.]|nr:MAG: ribosome small subunit-dependent GTPase A [Aquabacterium sp.]